VFLSIGSQLSDRVKRAGQRDEGSALVAVLGILLISIVIASVVSASAIHALGFTSATRAAAQSQAAADAGIAAAKVIMMTPGACTSTLTEITSTDPAYRVTFWKGTAAGGWTPGCPATSSTQARVISTGTAGARGANGQSSGDISYEELIFAKQVVQASGAAIYLGSGGQMNAFNVTSGNGETADIRVKSGNWECSASGVFQGNLIVEAGSATLSNSGCSVTGYIHAATGVSITGGGKVGGDVVASNGNVYVGGSSTEIGGTVYVKGNFTLNSGVVKGSVQATGEARVEGGSSTVQGSVWAKTVANITGHVLGNVISTSTTNVAISPGSSSDKRVGGFVSIGGEISSWADSSSCAQHYNPAGYACALKASGAVVGTITQKVTGQAAPVPKAAPVIPAWVDVDYKWSDWMAAGYSQQLLDWPSTLCNVDQNGAASTYWTTVKNLTIPTVIDTRSGCPSGVNFSSSAKIDLKLKTNLTLIGNSFKLEGMKINSIDATDRQFNLIIPDGRPTVAGRHCTSPAGGMEFNSTTSMGPHAFGMIYTPCNFSINNTSAWRGQIYAGSMTFSSADGLTYLPIGIPGIDLDGGTPSGSTSNFEITASRNRGDNGE
jgi:cytoskeletal protein CcmA (bactofilin family)